MGGASSAPSTSPDKTRLELEKLQQEVRKLEIENDKARGFAAGLLRWGPFVTVVAGVVTVLVGVRKEIREQRQQRKLDRDQRDKEHRERLEQAERARMQRERELEQQQLDARRRFDELFAQAVANLGAESESVQLSGVVLLQSFLRDDGAPFHEQVYAVVCANLGIKHTPLVNRFLVRAFEQAIRRRLAAHAEGEEPESLDLANCQMPRVDLHGLHLDGVDVAFATLRDANLVGARLAGMRGYDVDLQRARLSEADLTEARLWGAQARKAQFHNARLISTELRPSRHPAGLREAEFYGARMQGAHLNGADLTGAQFDDANLSDTYFDGATLDDRALRSILRSKVVKGTASWEKASFDDDIRSKLEEMAARESRA